MVNNLGGEMNQWRIADNLALAREAIDLSMRSESYFPNDPRKDRKSIILDNLIWLERFGEVNQFYFAYGLDRKNGPSSESFLPYNKFRAIRDKQNREHPDARENIASLQDKRLFEAFASSNGLKTTRTIATISRPEQADQLLRCDLDAFCKPVDGIKGKGAFRLRVQDGSVFINGREENPATAVGALSGRYILQDVISQHPSLSAIHPSSINTVRVVTAMNRGEVEVLIACLRVGAAGRSVDNWASGGLIIAIDQNAGVLRGPGFFKPGKGLTADTHPDTGITFDGYQLPYLRDAIEIAVSAHRHARGLHSVGWDLAITPDGPLLVEGNDNWDGAIPQTLDHTFKARLLATIQSRGSVGAETFH